jgi:hypothetical protein
MLSFRIYAMKSFVPAALIHRIGLACLQAIFPTVMLMMLCIGGILYTPKQIMAQPVVISEYYNVSATASGEWTELLVIQDNTSLVGYTLRDWSPSSDTWQGGVKFKDSPVWKNLRAGTIIWIGHRGNGVDNNPADGALRVGGENTALFDQVLFNGTSWDISALSINQSDDILQIIDPAGNHVHALSHGSSVSATFTGLPEPKLFHTGSISAIPSISVYPGATLSDFSGTNSGNSKTVNGIGSPTLPNFRINPVTELQNSAYWRSLRQPAWTAPLVNATISATGVSLSWNAAQDAYPADNYQGYLIARTEEKLSDTNKVPQDGKNYNPGDKIGDWVVVTNITGSQNITYTDLTSLPCGEAVKYRIFAYRYKEDDLENAVISLDSRYGRGRSYNETNFGQLRALRPVPPIPVITANGNTSFCEGSSVLLRLQGSLPTGTGYEWTKDGQRIANENTNQLTATSAGIYRLRILNPEGCTSESAPLSITVNPRPAALLLPEREVRICAGETITLQSPNAAATYKWFLDGAVIPANTQSIQADKAGSYRVLITDANGCSDTSRPTIIRVRDASVGLASAALDFGTLDGCKGSISQKITLNSTGTDTAFIDKINVPTGFQYINPPLPLILPPGSSISVEFAFAPATSGNFSGTARIEGYPCALSRTLNLSGTKAQSSVSQSLTSADFGLLRLCDNPRVDTTITIENKGTSPLIIENPVLNAPFSVLSPSGFPITIQSGNSLTITFRYAPGSAGNFSTLITIPYSAGSCRDTLRVSMRGEITAPGFTVSTADIKVPDMLGCTASQDTVITIQNTGKTTLTFENQPADKQIQILNSLPIIIPPLGSADILIRISPQTDGNFSIPLILMARECSAQQALRVTGNKLGASYAFSRTSIDFGNKIRCGTAQQVVDSIDLTLNVSGIAGDATISALSLNGSAYTTTIAQGSQTQGGKLNIRIYFRPQNDGTLPGTLNITLQPCNIPLSISLSGSLQTNNSVLSQSIISIPLTDSGSTGQNSFTFSNTGSSPLKILGLSGIKAPFTFQATQDINQPLAPGQDITFTILYNPIAAGRDSIVISLELDQPCPQSYAITLLASSRVPSPGDTSITAVARLETESRMAAPGDTVRFPFRIISDDIQKAKIFRFAFDIQYNPTLLSPLRLLAEANQAGFNLSFSESTPPGRLTITLENPDKLSSTSFIQAGSFCQMEFIALLGDSVKTGIELSNQNITTIGNNKLNLSYGKAEFALKDVCQLPTRLIRLEGGLALRLGPAHTLEYEIVSQDPTAVQLYSMDGRLISVLQQGSLLPGAYSVSLPTGLIQGNYFAILRAGHFTKVLPFSFQN